MSSPVAACPDFSAVRGKRLLIALSGGADSVALAVMLAEAREALDLELFAAHLDHGMRPVSADDAVWCRSLSKGLGIPFYTRRLDIPDECARTGEGPESAARRLRYAWLRGLREDLGADYIALAHHMDDQAETVLMHLARGTGPEGICGMAEFAGDLYRPLLGLRKTALMDYLIDRGQGWREDATNAVADNARNALRLHGIPELEKSYPGFVPAVARYAQSARIESDYLAEQTKVFLDGSLLSGPFGRFLRLTGDPHPAILRRAIRTICEGELSWERLNAVAALADRAHGSEQISDALFAERGLRGIYFLRPEPLAMREASLSLDGETVLPCVCTLEAHPAPPAPLRSDPMVQALDADALEGAVLRTRRSGDHIRPLGCGRKLLSDYFIDRKVDRPLRDHIALVARGDDVLWACGLGISEDAKLTGNTFRAVALTCRYGFDIGI